MVGRRDFLKKTGMVAMSIALPDCVSSKVKSGDGGLTLSRCNVSIDKRWDVIVVGGGPSGCAAAIAAAREGAKVLIIESTGSLGGMGTSGLLNAWCPFTDKEKIIYKGIAEKVFMEAKKGVPHASGFDWIPINTEYLKVVYDNLVTSFGVSVLFFSNMAEVVMKNEEIVDAVIVANKAGLTAYKAKIFIDCTGDGDLAAWAGAPYEMGDNLGTVQDGSLCFALSNIDPYEFSLLRTVQSFKKDSPIFEIVESEEYDLIRDYHINDKYMGPGYLGFNAGHIKLNSTDPFSLSSAMMMGRKMARQYRDGLAKYEPKTFAASYLAVTASLMGVRESRRIKCDYTFTLQDWLDRKEFEDGIGRNSYYIDVHKEEATKYPKYKKGESHGIPLRCLLPLGLKNVFIAGRCISTDHYAHGSLRVMPPALVTGEAVGTAAGLIYKSDVIDVHSIDTAKLRSRLKEMGQLL